VLTRSLIPILESMFI